MSYRNGDAMATVGSTFVPADKEAVLLTMSCNGNETNLAQCKNILWVTVVSSGIDKLLSYAEVDIHALNAIYI